eukprot:m.477305 g.477305  ORF g.477305 m.477305 type:complete len:86 (+) comp20803_c0_seq1:2040-2297(+)
MVYISGSSVQTHRPWSLSTITNAFWAFIGFITLFFRTLFKPSSGEKQVTGSWTRRDDGRGPPPGRRGVQGFRRANDTQAPPMGGG